MPSGVFESAWWKQRGCTLAGNFCGSAVGCMHCAVCAVERPYLLGLGAMQQKGCFLAGYACLAASVVACGTTGNPGRHANMAGIKRWQ